MIQFFRKIRQRLLPIAPDSYRDGIVNKVSLYFRCALQGNARKEGRNGCTKGHHQRFIRVTFNTERIRRRAFIVILFSLVQGTALSQNLDSLYGVWQNQTKTDAERTYAYVSYIWLGIISQRPDSALFLSEELHRFAKTQNYPKASAYGFHLQGVANYYMGNYPSSLSNYQKMLAMYEDLGDQNGIASSLNNIGNIHEELGNYPRALDYYERALALYQEIGHKENVALALGNIGLIHNIRDNDSLALEYNERALAIQKEMEDDQGIALSLNNIGNIYKEQEKYQNSLEYYIKALDIFKELNDNNGITSGLVNAGVSYQKQGRPALALDYCQKGFELAQKIGALNWQKASCQCLYDVYKELGQGEKALFYLEKLNSITDSLKAEETAKKLEQMEFSKMMLQDSIAKAEEARMIEEAHKEEMRAEEKTRNISIGVGALFVLLAIGFYSRWNYVKKSKAVLQAEKDRSENLLLNILPEEIARELKEKGKADAREFERVSILFTDFIGFTEQSAKLSASELVDEINYCFAAFDGIVEKYGLEKIKTIGDAYMAAGGLPVYSEQAVKNTVLAALEMQRFIMERISENKEAEKAAFQMRAGIHTGSVVAGIVGVKKFQYDIWGDAVNTASRIESSGTVGKVNISSSTYEFLKDDPELTFEKRGMVQAKGKGEIEMFFVELKNGKE